MGEDRDPVERFERTWKAWAERPSRVPPQEAGRRVIENARRRRQRGLTRRLLLVAAAVVAAVAVQDIRRSGPAPEATPTATALEPRPLGAGEVLIWLDAETPLYMTFEAPAAPRGGVP